MSRKHSKNAEEERLRAEALLDNLLKNEESSEKEPIPDFEIELDAAIEAAFGSQEESQAADGEQDAAIEAAREVQVGSQASDEEPDAVETLLAQMIVAQSNDSLKPHGRELAKGDQVPSEEDLVEIALAEVEWAEQTAVIALTAPFEVSGAEQDEAEQVEFAKQAETEQATADQNEVELDEAEQPQALAKQPMIHVVIPENSPIEEQQRLELAALAAEAFIEVPRRHHVWPLCITALVVFILITGGLTYFNRMIIADQAEQRALIQQDGDALLNESIALIQNADTVIVALDKATESKVTEDDIPRLEVLLDQCESTQATLDSAIEKAKKAKETFIDTDRKELAQYAQDAAEYRKKMIEMSRELTEYDISAMNSAISIEYAWTMIVDADTEMRAAVEAVSSGGADAVSESRDFNQSALEKLTLAEETFITVKQLFPEIDIQSLSDYLDAKKASAELALASDEAFLAGNIATANAKNEEFIAKDEEVVALAEQIPSDPISLVVKAYDAATEQLRINYQELRSKAADADAYLRAYLGVDTEQTTQ